jgi:hypothetical protein
MVTDAIDTSFVDDRPHARDLPSEPTPGPHYERLAMQIPATSTSALSWDPKAACDGAVGAQAPERATAIHAQPSMSHAEFRKVLHRAGYPDTRAQLALRGLPDPIDFGRDGEALLKRGVSLDRLVEAVGGSP